MTSAEVCIRGSGVVALSLGLALSRQGLDVALPALPPLTAAGDLRAYALNAASRRLLSALKVWDALPADAVTPVFDMHVEGDVAGAAIDFSAWRQRVEALAWIVDAGELEAVLRQAARFAPHLRLDCGEVAAPLTVLAEGRESAARAALGVHFDRQAYGQTAIAARLASGQPHGGLARQWFRSPDVLALLPLDRPRPGHGLGLVWSLPADRAQALLEAVPAEFEAALNEATAGAAGRLELVSDRASWPLAVARADRLCGPGWVLLGDAAHVVHPLAGQGLNLGLADVASLAEVLAAREPWRGLGDEILLRRHVLARAAATLAMTGLTDSLLHLFASPQPLLRELRNRGMTLLNHLAPAKRLLTARALDA
jgi:2-polyprenyl-6-methoxyphenol hydroxylase-like FAD-dependent oxidoreductase